MKIVMIHGQNHEGSTCMAARELAGKVGGDTREFFLPRDFDQPCLGCYTCIEDETKCPYYQEKHTIMQKVEEADLLIFTTPNYCMAPSAPMKAFMDLTFTYWISHKPRKCMYEKKAVVFSTTAGAGAGAAIKPIRTMLAYWGVPWIKAYGLSVQAMNWAGVSEKKKQMIEEDMTKLARKISVARKPIVPIQRKFMFDFMRKMQQAHMGSGETERGYWEKQGWLGKDRPWKSI